MAASPALFDLHCLDIAVELPELDGAIFASADAWVLAFAHFRGRPPHVLIYDVADGASLRASFDDGAAEDIITGAVRKRVLAVSWPRPLITSHDVDEAPERGWSVASWDLSLSPPAIVDVLPVTGEPIDVLVDEQRIVVSRADGLTVVSPPCGP